MLPTSAPWKLKIAWVVIANRHDVWIIVVLAGQIGTIIVIAPGSCPGTLVDHDELNCSGDLREVLGEIRRLE